MLLFIHHNPNPFKNEKRISYTSAKETSIVNVLICDLDSSLVPKKQIYILEGENEIIINQILLKGPGMYITEIKKHSSVDRLKILLVQ